MALKKSSKQSKSVQSVKEQCDIRHYVCAVCGTSETHGLYEIPEGEYPSTTFVINSCTDRDKWRFELAQHKCGGGPELFKEQQQYLKDTSEI